jgi:CheY-like chemotaxis protein
MITKFLLADDDADDGSIFCEAVMNVSNEMQCRTVENGRNLIELLSSNKGYLPEVIFLDINMPIMNGWDCLTQLKGDSRFNDIPTIIYSTSSLRKDIERAYRLGADLFITKPEDFDELCEIVKIVASNSTSSFSGELSAFNSVKMP